MSIPPRNVPGGHSGSFLKWATAAKIRLATVTTIAIVSVSRRTVRMRLRVDCFMGSSYRMVYSMSRTDSCDTCHV